MSDSSVVPWATLKEYQLYRLRNIEIIDEGTAFANNVTKYTYTSEGKSIYFEGHQLINGELDIWCIDRDPFNDALNKTFKDPQNGFTFTIKGTQAELSYEKKAKQFLSDLSQKPNNETLLEKLQRSLQECTKKLYKDLHYDTQANPNYKIEFDNTTGLFSHYKNEANTDGFYLTKQLLKTTAIYPYPTPRDLFLIDLYGTTHFYCFVDGTTQDSDITFKPKNRPITDINPLTKTYERLGNSPISTTFSLKEPQQYDRKYFRSGFQIDNPATTILPLGDFEAAINTFEDSKKTKSDKEDLLKKLPQVKITTKGEIQLKTMKFKANMSHEELEERLQRSVLTPQFCTGIYPPNWDETSARIKDQLLASEDLDIKSPTNPASTTMTSLDDKIADAEKALSEISEPVENAELQSLKQSKDKLKALLASSKKDLEEIQNEIKLQTLGNNQTVALELAKRRIADCQRLQNDLEEAFGNIVGYTGFNTADFFEQARNFKGGRLNLLSLDKSILFIGRVMYNIDMHDATLMMAPEPDAPTKEAWSKLRKECNDELVDCMETTIKAVIMKDSSIVYDKDDIYKKVLECERKCMLFKACFVNGLDRNITTKSIHVSIADLDDSEVIFVVTPEKKLLQDMIDSPDTLNAAITEVFLTEKIDLSAGDNVVFAGIDNSLEFKVTKTSMIATSGFQKLELSAVDSAPGVSIKNDTLVGIFKTSEKILEEIEEGELAKHLFHTDTKMRISNVSFRQFGVQITYALPSEFISRLQTTLASRVTLADELKPIEDEIQSFKEANETLSEDIKTADAATQKKLEKTKNENDAKIAAKQKKISTMRAERITTDKMQAIVNDSRSYGNAEELLNKAEKYSRNSDTTELTAQQAKAENDIREIQKKLDTNLNDISEATAKFEETTKEYKAKVKAAQATLEALTEQKRQADEKAAAEKAAAEAAAKQAAAEKAAAEKAAAEIAKAAVEAAAEHEEFPDCIVYNEVQTITPWPRVPINLFLRFKSDKQHNVVAITWPLTENERKAGPFSIKVVDSQGKTQTLHSKPQKLEKPISECNILRNSQPFKKEGGEAIGKKIELAEFQRMARSLKIDKVTVLAFVVSSDGDVRFQGLRSNTRAEQAESNPNRKSPTKATLANAAAEFPGLLALVIEIPKPSNVEEPSSFLDKTVTGSDEDDDDRFGPVQISFEDDGSDEDDDDPRSSPDLWIYLPSVQIKQITDEEQNNEQIVKAALLSSILENTENCESTDDLGKLFQISLQSDDFLFKGKKVYNKPTVDGGRFTQTVAKDYLFQLNHLYPSCDFGSAKKLFTGDNQKAKEDNFLEHILNLTKPLSMFEPGDLVHCTKTGIKLGEDPRDFNNWTDCNANEALELGHSYQTLKRDGTKLILQDIFKFNNSEPPMGLWVVLSDESEEDLGLKKISIPEATSRIIGTDEKLYEILGPLEKETLQVLVAEITTEEGTEEAKSEPKNISWDIIANKD